MKKRTTMLLLATAALTHGISCYGSTADSSGITMPVRNTIKIEASDSKETIIEKASHVVPTANQLSALHNECIDFHHIFHFFEIHINRLLRHNSTRWVWSKNDCLVIS
jgi:alpha-L-fucosidase